MFFSDYWPLAKNDSLPTQLKKLGYKTRSFCNCQVSVLYPLKTGVKNERKNNVPYREDIINDLGLTPLFTWNREGYGDNIKDY